MRRTILWLLVLVGVILAVPENNPYQQPSTWNGYGVDWTYRSLRIGLANKDSLLEDGWIFADSAQIGYATFDSLVIDGIGMDSITVNKLTVNDTAYIDEIWSRAGQRSLSLDAEGDIDLFNDGGGIIIGALDGTLELSAENGNLIISADTVDIHGIVNVGHILNVDSVVSNTYMVADSTLVYWPSVTGGMDGTLYVGSSSSGLTHTLGDDAYYNTFVGERSGSSSTTGSRNTALGYNSLTTSTTGDANTALGYNSLSAITIGYQNTAVGEWALALNSVGRDNTAVGNSALLYATGDDNIAIGGSSLKQLTTGTGNIAIGISSGVGITTGSYNTLIGSVWSGLTSGLSNNIIIADGQGNQRIRILDTGNVGIGTISPDFKLQIDGTVAPETAHQDLGTAALPWDIFAGEVYVNLIHVTDLYADNIYADYIDVDDLNADSINVGDIYVGGIAYIDSIQGHSPVVFLDDVIADSSLSVHSFNGEYLIVSAAKELSRGECLFVEQTANASVKLSPNPEGGDVFYITFSNVSGGTLDGNGHNINGTSTISAVLNSVYMLVYNGTQWRVF